jgi:hypothetical protein
VAAVAVQALVQVEVVAVETAQGITQLQVVDMELLTPDLEEAAAVEAVARGTQEPVDQV